MQQITRWMLQAINPFLLFLSLPLAAAARDNFLVVVLDDVGVDAIGVYSDDVTYGHDGVGAALGPTPTIDGIAAEGMLFRHAYANPMCSPTRAAALTGRYGFRNGVGIPEDAYLRPSETIIPEALAATHANAAIGKWHLGGNDADHPNEAGFDNFSGTLGNLGQGVTTYFSWRKTVQGATTAGWPAYATTDNVNDAIGQIAGFGDDPWFVWLAFNAAHTPFHVPTAGLNTIAVDDASDDLTKYQAAVEAIDTELDRLLASIPSDVLADTTIIVFGDNGTPKSVSVPPFRSNHAKSTVYEGGIRVPFIVRSPYIAEADRGRESLALVHSVDIFATLAEIAGVSSATARDSVSFLPYLQDPDLATLPTRPYVYSEMFTPDGSGSNLNDERTIRTETFKLIWRNGVYEELFNLDDDPFERDNLLLGALDAIEVAAYDE